MSGFDLNAKMVQKPFENEFGKLVQKIKRNSFSSVLHFLISACWPFFVLGQMACSSPFLLCAAAHLVAQSEHRRARTSLSLSISLTAGPHPTVSSPPTSRARARHRGTRNPATDPESSSIRCALQGYALFRPEPYVCAIFPQP